MYGWPAASTETEVRGKVRAEFVEWRLTVGKLVSPQVADIIAVLERFVTMTLLKEMRIVNM